jgi:hypothetical protein
MASERWLRQSPWRYVLLAHVVTGLLALAFLGLAVTGWFLGLTGGPPDAGRWLTGLAFLWGCVAAPLSLGYLLERRAAWRVDLAGITVYNASGRQVAFLAWSEVAWVRVFPLGWVFAAGRSERAPVWGLVGVAREPARWLRHFARERLRDRPAATGTAADGSCDPSS